MQNEDLLTKQLHQLRGELRATQALVLGLANLLLTREAFQAEGSERIQVARDAVLALPVSEDLLIGIDRVDHWLKSM